MNQSKPRGANRVPGKRRDTEVLDLLKEVFVCVSIPVVAFSFVYITLDTILRLFLG
jgi:hypothetical protein